jgi:hypothetical protein
MAESPWTLACQPVVDIKPGIARLFQSYIRSFSLRYNAIGKQSLSQSLGRKQTMASGSPSKRREQDVYKL